MTSDTLNTRESASGLLARSEIDRSIEPLLSVRGLKKHFPVRRGTFARAHSVLKAVGGVSFDL